MKILASTILLLLIMSMTVPAYADNHDEKGHDPGHNEIWERIKDLESYVDDQLQIVLDRLTAIEEEQSDETGDIKTLFTQQTVMENDIGNLQIQVNNIPNEALQVNDLESRVQVIENANNTVSIQEFNDLKTRVLFLETINIPDMTKEPFVKQVTNHTILEEDGRKTLHVSLMIESPHSGGATYVMFGYPGSSSIKPIIGPTSENGGTGIQNAMYHEIGLRMYSYSHTYTGGMGNVLVQLTGTINQNLYVPLE